MPASSLRKYSCVAVSIPSEQYDIILKIADRKSCNSSLIIRFAISEWINNGCIPSAITLAPKGSPTYRKCFNVMPAQYDHLSAATGCSISVLIHQAITKWLQKHAND